MDTLFKNIEPKWFVVIYGLYIISRSIQILFDNDFALKAVNPGYYQVEIHFLKFSYLLLSLLHPLIFTIVSVEIAKRSFSFKYFLLVLSFHLLVIEIVSILTLLDFIHALIRIDLDDFLKITKLNPAAINELKEGIKSLFLVICSPLIFILSIYWWKKPIFLFNKKSKR